MIDEALRAAARRVLDACRAKNLKLAVAESCTGGLLAAALTEIPGSSDVFDRGFVTYSSAAKQAMLDVPASVLETRGAVSKETAEVMAMGALERSGADVTAAVTGVAGPGGGAALESLGEFAERRVEHRAHQRTQNTAAELVGDEELDVAGLLRDRAEAP